MTDKEKILAKIESLKELKSYINSLQEEPVSERFAFKTIPRLLEMIESTDRAKAYIAKLSDALEVEGYSTDAKIVREHLKIMNGEKVPMATMDDEPISEELEEASYRFACKCNPLRTECSTLSPNPEIIEAFKTGVKWQKEHLWKSIDGRELPEIDRDVICLLNCGKVVKSRRLSKNDNLYVPETYGKGEWSYPNIKYWLDCEIPKLEETEL